MKTKQQKASKSLIWGKLKQSVKRHDRKNDLWSQLNIYYGEMMAVKVLAELSPASVSPHDVCE